MGNAVCPTFVLLLLVAPCSTRGPGLKLPDTMPFGIRVLLDPVVKPQDDEKKAGPLFGMNWGVDPPVKPEDDN